MSYSQLIPCIFEPILEVLDIFAQTVLLIAQFFNLIFLLIYFGQILALALGDGPVHSLLDISGGEGFLD